MKYAADKECPILNYPGEDFGAAYQQFYEQITPAEE